VTTTKQGQPTSCPVCKSTDLRTTIKAIDGGAASEYLVECKACDIELGYYAYGAWDPCYFRELGE